MAEQTGIEWADHTINAWIGCAKVSEGCAHCYAERVARRVHVRWGRDADRWLIKADTLKHRIRRWNRAAQHAGVRRRVFWNSLSDFLEDRPELRGPRLEAMALMEEAASLDHLILTKRPENAAALLPLWCAAGWPANVWLGVSVESPDHLSRLDWLSRLPVHHCFVSAEPLLDALSLAPWLGLIKWTSGSFTYRTAPQLQWVIVGGESGPGARPCHVKWTRTLLAEGQAAAVPVFVTQLGACPVGVLPLRHPRGGDPAEWPEDLRVRQVPGGR